MNEKENNEMNRKLMKGFVGAMVAIVIASMVALPSGTSSDGEDIIINEIMYDPEGNEHSYEWIELYNNNTAAIDIDGWILNGTIGGSDTILNGTMGIGEYLIISNNVSAFQERYPSVTCRILKGNWSALGNAGDWINLSDDKEILIDSVNYPGGFTENYSAERNATGWQESFIEGGTPSARNSVLPPESCVDIISPYWQSSTPFAITATIYANSSAIQNVTLWYRYSTDNSSWGPWLSFEVDNDTPWEWSFTAPDGHYQFYSIANDTLGNEESPPALPDAICGIDTTKPTSSVDPISPHWRASTPFAITATANNDMGIKNVSLYYRYSNDNSSWDEWAIYGTDDTEPYNWSFTGSDGYYQFYSIAIDNAGNIEDAPAMADSIAGIDTTPPTIELIYPIGGENISGILEIKWNATDNIANLNGTIWIQYSDDNGTTWNEIVYNINNTEEYNWITTIVSDGSYLIMVNATDYAGNTDSNESSSFIIDNTKPIINLERPRGYLYIFDRKIIPLLFDRTMIIGSITIEVNATDNLSGIDKVEFFIDEESKYNDTTSPYNWSWDETAFFRHSIKVVAYDEAGNEAIDEIEARIFNFSILKKRS